MLLHKPPGIVGVQRRPPIYAEGPLLSGAGNIADSWALTINGTRVAPTFVYLPSDINTGTGAWAEHFGTAAGAMTLQAGSPTYDVDSLLGVNGSDKGVKGDGTAYWQVAGNSFGDITTEDFVLEFIINRHVWGANLRLFDKRTSGNGWSVLVYATGEIGLYFDDGTGNASLLTAVLPAGAACHVMMFVDRSGSAQSYVNGVASGSPAVVSGAALTLAKASALTLMAVGSGASAATSTIGSIAMWQGAAWLNTHLQATVAAERYARFTGLYPQHSIPGAYVPTVTRATTKYYYRASQSKLHMAGSGLLCIDEDGKHIEASAQNLLVQSQAHATTWGKLDPGDVVNNNAAVAPDGTTTMSSFVPDSTSGAHHIFQTSGVLSAAVYCVSTYAKKGAGSSEHLLLYEALRTSARAYFDLTAGTCNTYSGIACGMKEVATGVWRCWYTFTASAQTHQFRLGYTDGNNNYNLTSGDGATVEGYWWGTQLELGTYPSSYIPTVAAAVTRNADTVTLPAAIATRLSAAGQGTVRCKVTKPAVPSAAVYAWSLNDQSLVDEIACTIDTSGHPHLLVVAGSTGQADVDSAVNVCDGAEHEIVCSWSDGRFAILVDNGTPAVDNEGTVPTGLDSFYEGRSGAGTLYLNGHITLKDGAILEEATL